MNKLLNTKQVCKILGVQLNAVYGFILSGKLKAHKLGGNGNSKRHWRIREQDLESFINGQVATGLAHTEHTIKISGKVGNSG